MNEQESQSSLPVADDVPVEEPGEGHPERPAEQPTWQLPPWAPLPPGPPARPSSRSASGVLLTLSLILAMVLGLLIGHYAWTPPSSPSRVSTPTTPSSTPTGSSASGAPPNAAALARSTDPRLVDVNTVISSEDVEGAGTGMVLTANGDILTNNHVIEGETSLSVTDVGNGKTYRATVLGYDLTQDVAVVRLTAASGLKTVRLGNSSTVASGQGVVAIGNAGGAGGTPSYAAGSVTATNQSISAEDQVNGRTEQLSGLIEINADIEQGDSGGALVDSSGRVIGMITAGSAGFDFQGATEGYAIPINQALTIAREIESGKSSATVHVGPTAFLGVEVLQTPSGVTGAEIFEAIPGDPAALAGLGAGDIITSLGGHSVSSTTDLTNALLTETPGTSVTVGYLNPSGAAHTVTVKLGSGPPQ